MTNEMIERVARAIDPTTSKIVYRLVEFGAPRAVASELLPMDKARVALEAMKVPTLSMIEAGQKTNNLSDTEGVYIFPALCIKLKKVHCD